MAQNVRKNLTAIVQSGSTALPLDMAFVGNLPFYVGTAYTGTMARIIGKGGAGAPYAFSIVAGGLPTGLTLASTGIITGTPTVQGNFSVSIQVQDAGANTFVRTFVFTAAAPLFWLAGGKDPTTAQRTRAYNFQFRVADATGSTAGITYTSGTLPAGLSISSGGLITGTPTVVGTTYFTVTATKAGVGTLTWSTSITVVAAIGGLATLNTPAELRNAVIGTPVDVYFTWSSLNGVAPYTWDIAANSLPAGLSMDSQGRVTGTPTAITGTSFVNPTIRVTDAMGFAQSGAANINVGSPIKSSVGSQFVALDSQGNQTTVDYYSQFFGGALDGNVTINGSNNFASFAPLSGGVNIMSRHMYADTLTITGAGILQNNGIYDIYCDVLDISNAAAASIRAFAIVAGGGGLHGNGGTAGGSGAANISNNGSTRGGGRANQPDGVGAQGGGKGGNGASGAGGPGGASTNTDPIIYTDPYFANNDIVINRVGLTLDWIHGGNDGPGGGGGAGNTTTAGGNGGDGGKGGGRIRIFARTIITSASTPAGVIDASGCPGATGVNGSVSGVGGGGGGCGAGGGYVRVVYLLRSGPVVTNLIRANGGAGGSGGNGGGGAGVFGRGGYGGEGGQIIINCADFSFNSVTIGTVGGTTAVQAGAGAGTCQASL